MLDKWRKMGYRLTPQRQIAIKSIGDNDTRINAEETCEQVVAKYPRINISTVCRNSELLKKLDLVYKIHLGEGCISYHPEEKGHHHHLICRDCSGVIDVGESVLFPVQTTLLQAFNF